MRNDADGYRQRTAYVAVHYSALRERRYSSRLDTLANLCAVLNLDANEILGINQK